MSNIVHASIDESGNIRNGKVGDQTGKEVCVRSWYKKAWDVMLRYPDETVAQKSSEIAKKLAKSNLVGYDQNARNTLYKELKKNNFDVDKYIRSGIKTETDCSAFMYACYCCSIPSMRSDSNAPTTSTMRKYYLNKGFKAYTDKKYLTSDSSLLNGDILVYEGHHTVMSCDHPAFMEYKLKITCTSLYVRKGPGKDYEASGAVHKDDILTIIEEEGGWGRISGGWISLNPKYSEKIK